MTTLSQQPKMTTHLSKSDYLLGIKCPLALWYKKHRKDLTPEHDEARLEQGNEVGALARQYFGDSVVIQSKPWLDSALTETEAAIESKADVICEAVCRRDNGDYCAIDILRNNKDGTFDMIEVKSSTEPKDYHIVDLSFQYYVFSGKYKIRDCYVMTIDNTYVRHGDSQFLKSFFIVVPFVCFTMYIIRRIPTEVRYYFQENASMDGRVFPSIMA